MKAALIDLNFSDVQLELPLEKMDQFTAFGTAGVLCCFRYSGGYRRSAELGGPGKSGMPGKGL